MILSLLNNQVCLFIVIDDHVNEKCKVNCDDDDDDECNSDCDDNGCEGDCIDDG